MLLWKSWFDLRLRFCYSAIVLLLVLGLFLSTYPTLNSLKDSLAQEELRRLAQDYHRFIEGTWFSADCMVLVIAAIVLGLGGVLVEKGGGARLITLSLPAKRWKWAFTHAVITSALLFLLALVSTAALLLGSFLIGKSYPLNSALLGMLGAWLGCFPWIGLSLLLNSFFHSDMRSGLILFPAGAVGPQLLLSVSPSLYRWCPRQLANPGIWSQSFLWKPLLISVVIGLIGITLAAIRFTREEC